MLKHLKRLLVSHTCYACGQGLVGEEEVVCMTCFSQIEQTGFHHQPLDNELYYRFAGKVALGGVACLFYFDKKGKLQSLIQALKYQDAPQVGRFLGGCLGDQLNGHPMWAEIDVLVPVPLHSSRRIKRGYNQAEEIARGMAAALGIPVDTKSLVRTRKTRTQTRKTGDARWENVSGAFLAKRRPGSRILLVDDVITTGSTLEACIKAFELLESPPDSIHVAAIGMARKAS